MDNNKPSYSCQLLNVDSPLDTFSNESGERSFYKYPDKSCSFQSVKLQSVLHDVTNDSSFSQGEGPCKYPVHTPVATVAELNSVLSAGTYSESYHIPRVSGKCKIYNSTTSVEEDSRENNFQQNSSLNKNSTYNLRNRNKISVKKSEKAVMHSQSNVHINNSFPNVNCKETSRLRTLQRNDSSFSQGEEPCKYPVHTPVATLAELNSLLSAGTDSEPYHTPRFSGKCKMYDSIMSVEEDSKENSFQQNSSHNKNSTYNLRNRNKISIKKTEKAVMHSQSNVHVNNSVPNVNRKEMSKLKTLQRKAPQIKHSDIFESVFKTDKMLTETTEGSNNSLNGLKNKDIDSLNSTSNMGNTGCLRANLSNSDSIYSHMLCSINNITKYNETEYEFFEKNAEKVQIDDVNNNISFIPELNFENTDTVKDSDNSFLSTDPIVHYGIDTNEVVAEKVFSGSEFSYTSSEDSETTNKNSATQKYVQSLFTRQSTENEKLQLSFGSTSNVNDSDLDKVNTSISYLKNTSATVRNTETESHQQTISRIVGRKKHVKNKTAQSRYTLKSTSANKENVQLFHPCCNDNVTNDTNSVNMSMSQNKHKPPVNMAEDLTKTTEKGKITKHVRNTFEDEQFVIEITSEMQCTSHVLTKNDTDYSQTVNIIQNHIKCMHNKVFTINCDKSINSLDVDEQTCKHCDSSASVTTAISNAVISEVNKPEELNNEDSHDFISGENNLKKYCFKLDPVKHSAMVSQANSFVNEEEIVSKQLSFSKNNNKMKIRNSKLSEDMCEAHYRTISVEKLKRQEQLADLHKRIFDDSFYETEVRNGKLKLDVRFSELQENTRVTMSTANLPTDFVGMHNNNRSKQEIGNIKQMNKNKRKPTKHMEWKTPSLTKYIISKLRSSYGIKSNLTCKKLMQFLSKKIRETVENNFDFHIPVNEIKIELARLNIIETNLDFYLFVLKYFRQYEQDFVYKSVPCIQTCGRPNLVARPPKGQLSEKILYYK